LGTARHQLTNLDQAGQREDQVRRQDHKQDHAGIGDKDDADVL
jgi:hypothetical protein